MINAIKKYIAKKNEIKQDAQVVWSESLRMSIIEGQLYDDVIGESEYNAISEEVAKMQDCIRQKFEGMVPSYRAKVMAEVRKCVDKTPIENYDDRNTMYHSSDYNNARTFIENTYADAVERDGMVMHKM